MAADKHGKVEGTIDTVQDMAGAAVGKATAAMGGGSSEQFVENAALGDMFEIRAGEIALRRAAGQPVRELAEEMIKDHRQSQSELQYAMQRSTLSDLPSPDSLDARRQGFIDNLDAAPDSEFDKTYVRQQLAAHEEAVTLFRNYKENGDNTELRHFAGETLPVLERHLQHVRQLRDEME